MTTLYYKILFDCFFAFFPSIFLCLILLQFGRCAGERSDLAEKVRQLKDQSNGTYVLKLNNTKFREFILTPIKNYSFVVMFAAMASHRQCSTCSLVHDEFELTAKSFRIVYGGICDRLFFGFVDYDQNAEIFQSMKIDSVPSVIYFPPRRKLQMKIDVFDMQRHGYLAEAMAKWVFEKSGIEFRILRPPVLFGAATLITIFFIGSLILYFRYEDLGLDNRTIWSIVAVIFCLLMTSGQIWNYLRSPLLFAKAPSGIGYTYVYASSNGQFIAETFMVFLLNAGIVVITILFIDNGNSDPCLRRNKAYPFYCIGGIALLFNILLALFRIKAPNYPLKGLL